jgi:hypothetical protein
MRDGSSDAPMMAPALLRVNDEVHGGDPKAKKTHGSFPSDLTDQVTQAYWTLITCPS